VEFDFPRLSEPHLSNPYPLYARARAEAPVFYSPDFGLWVLTRHRDVLAALTDPRRFSSVFFMRTPTGAPAEVGRILADGYPELPMLVNQDPPDHTRMRALVNKTFLPARVAALEPVIREIAERRIDTFVADGHADLMRELAFPLPMEVICTLIGLPAERHTQLKAWTEDLVALGSPASAGERLIAAARGSVAFQRYLADEIDRRRSVPSGDLLTALVTAELDDGRRMTTAELVNLLIVMIFAGHETTTNLIGNTLPLVLAHPGGDTSAAVFEGLRMDSPVQGMFRTTTVEVVVSGVSIPAGAQVLLLFGSANRDGDVFDEPDTFRPGRADGVRQLGFGRGIHYCIGAALALLEARIVIDALVRRLPGLRMTEDPTYAPSLMHRGPLGLQASW
jgi:cytochrome P450